MSLSRSTAKLIVLDQLRKASKSTLESIEQSLNESEQRHGPDNKHNNQSNHNLSSELHSRDRNRLSAAEGKRLSEEAK